MGVNVAEFEFPAYYNFFLKACILMETEAEAEA